MLIQTALKAFLEHGYDAVPLKEIAAEAGIRQASIYYHFQSKQELLEACAHAFFENWYKWMENPQLMDADLQTMLRHIVNALGMDSGLIRQLYGAETETGQYRFVMDILTYCPQQMSHMREFNGAFFTLLADKIEDAKQNGVIAETVSPRSVYVLLSALMEGSNILHFTDPDIDWPKEASRLFDLLWEGISHVH